VSIVIRTIETPTGAPGSACHARNVAAQRLTNGRKAWMAWVLYTLALQAKRAERSAAKWSARLRPEVIAPLASIKKDGTAGKHTELRREFPWHPEGETPTADDAKAVTHTKADRPLTSWARRFLSVFDN
jgi:hypothetical protein